MNSENALLTAAEAAELLRVSQSCLSEWRRRGAGPRYYQPAGPGTRILYKRSDLETWLESGAVELAEADGGPEVPSASGEVSEVDIDTDTDAGGLR